MRSILTLLVVASVASAGPIAVSGFDPTPTSGSTPGASDPAAGNFGSIAFVQDALYYLARNVTNGNRKIAVFRDDAATLDGFSAAFAYAGAGFNNASSPNRSAVAGGIDDDLNSASDWSIGFYDSADLLSMLAGGTGSGVIGSYGGTSSVTTVAGGPTTLSDIGVIVLFGNLNSASAINSVGAFAAAGGGIYGVGNGPGSVATPDPDFDWLAALFPSLALPNTMEAGSPLRGPDNGGSVPSTGAFFQNWSFYFQNPDGTPGGLGSSPESFSTINLNGIDLLAPVIGQTDGGVGAFAGQTTNPVPEPGSILLVAAGVALLVFRSRRGS